MLSALITIVKVVVVGRGGGLLCSFSQKKASVVQYSLFSIVESWNTPLLLSLCNLLVQKNIFKNNMKIRIVYSHGLVLKKCCHFKA